MHTQLKQLKLIFNSTVADDELADFKLLILLNASLNVLLAILALFKLA